MADIGCQSDLDCNVWWDFNDVHKSGRDPEYLSQVPAQPSRGFQESDGGRDMGELDFTSEQELALRTLLSPTFVDAAFSLPTSSCGVIWNLLKEEIALLAGNNVHISNVESDLLHFLEAFFSRALVGVVKANLSGLSQSFLGPCYSLRPGRISLAIRIVNDLFWEHVGGGSTKGGPLVGFMGEACDGDDTTSRHDGREGEWQEVRRRKGKGKADSSNGNSREGREQQHGRGRGGGRRGGGRQHPRVVYATRVLHFVDCERVEVVLSAFETPPRPIRSRRDAQAREQIRRRKHTIGERSLHFSSHENVVEGPPYDPFVDARDTVHLYHGSQTRSFSSFQARGIDPDNLAANEFQAGRAFYVSNSIRHAFEHPLHYHPAGSLDNPVAVLVFHVDVLVLHGEVPRAGDSTPFSVLWFDEPDHEWAAFCEANMNRTRMKHDYDIVIGHVCTPIPSRYEPLLVDLEGGAPLTQVAFCTERAMAWMESCMRRVYFEKRISGN